LVEDNRLLRALVNHLPHLAGSATVIGTGMFLTFDDIKDFGRLDRPHHVYLGLAAILGGLTALALTISDIMDEAGLKKAGKRYSMKEYSERILEMMK